MTPRSHPRRDARANSGPGLSDAAISWFSRAASLSLLISLFFGSAASARAAADGVSRIELTAESRESIETSIERTPTRRGFDAVVSFQNVGTAPSPLPDVRISGIELAGDVRWADWNNDGSPVSLDHEHANLAYPHGPNGAYSPVATFGDAERAVAVMLLFDPLESRHDIGGVLYQEQGAWTFELLLTSRKKPPARALRYEASLAPGERRELRLAVRVGDAGTPLARLLEPYVSFFRDAHGAPTYRGDPRPVRGLAVARTGLTSDDNPFGFEEPQRPDVHGWRLWSMELARVAQRWRRVMLWAPSGVYRVNSDLNFPHQFTSMWERGEKWGHKLGDAPERLSRVVAGTGLELGLWWGRASQLMERWDASEWTPFDPTNPEHRASAFRQLDLAREAGATMIGLDAFPGAGGLALWDAQPWLAELQERYPEMTFITEKQKPDFMHRIAPTYFFAYDRSAEGAASIRDASFLKGPHALAGLLNPGHETWAGAEFDLLERLIGRELSDAERLAEIRRLLEAGYVPVAFGRDLDPGELASGLRAPEPRSP